MSYFKIGAKARYTYRKWNGGYDYYGMTFDTVEERVTVLSLPRDVLGRFVSPYDAYDEDVKVEDSKGKQFYVGLNELEVFRPANDLSKKDWEEIFKDVGFGSLFYADYRNSLDVDERIVCDCCEGFGEYIEWDDDLATAENFAEYAYEIEY